MKMVSTEWKDLQAYEKGALIVESTCSVCVILLISLQMAGIYEVSMHLLEPFLGIFMLAQGILKWKRNRKIALLSIGMFLFIVLLILLEGLG